MLIERGKIVKSGYTSVFPNNTGFVFINASDRLFLAEFMLVDESLEITMEYDDMLDADIILVNNDRVWTSQDDKFLSSEVDEGYFRYMVRDGLLDFDKDMSLVENIDFTNREIVNLFDEFEPYISFGGIRNTFRYISFINSNLMYDMRTTKFTKDENVPSYEVYIGDLKALHGFTKLCDSEWYYKSSSQKELDGVEYYLIYNNSSVYLISMLSKDSLLITRSGHMISTNEVRHLACSNIGYTEILNCSRGRYMEKYTDKIDNVTLLEYQFMCYLMRCSDSLEDCLVKARQVIKNAY